MNSSVETRYPLLDDDVIAFCASIAPEYKLHGLTDKWLLRQVAARTLPARIANRPKTMFRASRSEAFLDQRPAALGRPALEPRVAQGDGLVRSRGRRARARRPGPVPADHPQADHHGPEPDVRDRHPALAPYLPGGRAVRAADLGSACLQARANRRASTRQFPTGSRPIRPRLRRAERRPLAEPRTATQYPSRSRLPDHPRRFHERQPPGHAVDQVVPLHEASHQEGGQVHLYGEESRTGSDQPGQRGEEKLLSVPQAALNQSVSQPIVALRSRG